MATISEPPKPLTWKEVARAAGVSPTTASLALNNHPRVAARTRQRVVEAAARLGFVNNHAARRLARSRADSRSASFEQIALMYVIARSIGVDPACVAMMRGAERELGILDACLLFLHVDRHEGWERAHRLVRSGFIDGWLISGAVDDAAIQRLKRLGAPHVIIGDHLCQRQQIHSVNIDYHGVGYSAATHLAERGHERVAFFGGKLFFPYQTQTLQGFIAGMRASGIDYDETRWVLRKQTIRHFLETSADKPTAIFAAEPAEGPELVRLLHALGLRAPEQISVLCCELAGTWPRNTPELTRLELPMDDVGRHGALLLHRVATEPQLTRSEMKLAATFIDRGTTGPVGGSIGG